MHASFRLRNFFKMSDLGKLLANQDLINSSMDSLKIELTVLERVFKQFCRADNSCGALQNENTTLEEQIRLLREELVELESARGIRQIPLPRRGLLFGNVNLDTVNFNRESASNISTPATGSASNISTPATERASNISTPATESASNISTPATGSASNSSTPAAGSAPEKPKENPKQSKKEAKKKQEKKESKESEPNNEGPIDVSRLDLRVGKIVEVNKHPDADSLYVEKIDVGGEKPITVVSGLVKHVPLEEMQDRMVVVLCNLKPAKMRGVLSEAMVMCASSPTGVEVLSPPPAAAPGDRVSVPGYPPAPDSVLNPKKKIFEQVAPDLKTDSDLQATYKGCPWTVEGKGVVTTKSLTNVNIK